MNFHRILGSAATALTLLVAACGGGGSADGGIGGTGGGGGGGIGGTGVALGTITGFGSVFVNGVEFSSSGTVIKRDDSTVSQSDLRVGMVARVDGSITNQQATTITVDSAIKGRVEQVIDANRMRVMGQTVQTDSQTLFENGVRPVQGDYIEVHGLPVAGGVVAAGFVERKSALASPPFVVAGFIASQNAAAQTFTVGALSVAYSGATISDMPGGSWVGLLVEVKGTACAGNPVCGTLTASKVEPWGLQVASASEAEVEGFVTSVSGSSFVLGNQAVAIGAGTRFENGTAADLVVGVKLEAEGSISGGVLTATKVQFKDGVRIEANVVSNGAGGLTLQGLPGIVVEATSNTELDGVTSVGALVAGNHLRIRGRLAPSNRVVASELELRSNAPDTRIELRGPVSAASNPTLTILGVAVDTTSISESNFKDRSDNAIGRAAFFSAAVSGQAVKVKGDLIGATPRWDEAELED